MKYINEVILWFLVTIPIFFSSYFNKNAVLPLCVVAITLAIYLLVKQRLSIPNTLPNRFLGIIGILSIILLPFSLLIIHSIPGILWWVALFGAFTYSQIIITDRNALIRLSLALVASSLVFAIQSSYYFIIIGLSSYTRLNSMIGLHNVYGGYLILPFLISLSFAFSTTTRTKQILWTIASSFLLSNVILTFSRGTWVSILLAIVISSIVFNQQIRSFLSRKMLFRKKTLENLIIVACIAIICGLFSIGIWSTAKHFTIIQISPETSGSSNSKTIDVFSGENMNENAFTARLAYWKDALNVSLRSPLVGFGPGNYADALAHWKTDPSFFASDPHNFFLKLLVEQGIVIFAIFIAFLISLVIPVKTGIQYLTLNSHFRGNDNNIFLYVAIFTGLIASIIHISMEVDWNSPALMLIFFIFAGALYEITRNSSDSISPATINSQKKTFPRSLTIFLIIVLIIASIVTLWFFLANNSRLDGDYYLEKAKYSEALGEYTSAISINPYGPDSWFGRSKVYFSLKKYNEAKSDIDQAIKLYPTFGNYYSMRAKLDSILGDKVATEIDLRNSIEYRPNNDLSDYLRLVILYTSQNRNSEAESVAEDIIPIYKKYQSTLWFRNDPRAETIRMNLMLIEGLNKITK